MVSTESARSTLPLDTRFELGPDITPEQQLFLDTHGYLVFNQVASADEVQRISDELDRVSDDWVQQDRAFVNGIPVFYGKNPEGKRWVQRFTYTSTFSDYLRAFVRDERFEPVRKLVSEGARVGDDELDGVVVNRYVNNPGSAHPRLGWHTDGLRDLFYLRMPQQMLNVGLHFDACPPDNGGLCLIPGSHNQGFWSMCFRKLYFLSHAPDPDEIHVATLPGDLTVHDGRLWHRVQRSSRTGAASLRRSMYVPYVTGPVSRRDEESATPFYHRLGQVIRWAKRKLG